MSEHLTGRDIAAECARHQVTHRDLADALSIHPSQLSPIVTGSVEASQDYLQRCIDKVREIARSRNAVPASQHPN